MPIVNVTGYPCYYRLDGPEERPVVVFAHSLGLDHGMWEQQAADLAPHVRVLRYDIRGHGASAAPEGEYTIDDLGQDALALADALGIERFAFCGLSIGGMIGQWLAAHASQRLTHLVLANTTPRLSDPQLMERRRQTVLGAGMSAVADTALTRFFTPRFLSSNSPPVASARRTVLSTSPTGYAGCCAAVRDADLTALLPRIRTPTLVISGDHDVAMPWEGHGDLLTQSIAGARAVHLPAAHISNLERPRSFSRALIDFLLPAPSDALEAGFAVRRSVLGDAHVDRSVAATTDFTRGFQELLTKLAWGTIWTRLALDRRSRRLLVLTATAALGRWEEFRLHVRTGLDAELEPSDLEEALLQLAVYAGIPAANTAFTIAAEELGKRKPTGSS